MIIRDSKEIHKIVNERSQGLCEVCYSSYMVQHHHIVGGKGKRKECETQYSIKALCWNCHHGNEGVHGKNGEELNKRLVEELEQTYIDLGLDEETINKLMGRVPFKSVFNYKK